MALYELLLVYYFFFRMKCLKGIDFLAGGDCQIDYELLRRNAARAHRPAHTSQ